MKIESKPSGSKIILIIIVVLLLFLIGVAVKFVFIFYKNSDEYALESTDKVSVKEQGGGTLFFDGPGSRSAMVFYPGASVDELSYCALLKEIASGGIDCFLVKMPLHLPIIGINLATSVIDNNSYEKWYIGGHSFGGAMACIYAEKNTAKLDGIVLLGAYSPVDLVDSGLDVLLIRGSNDNVLSYSRYEKGKPFLPESALELVIVGGNHCQFGTYGFQKGDGTASITPEEQRRIASGYITANLCH